VSSVPIHLTAELTFFTAEHTFCHVDKNRKRQCVNSTSISYNDHTDVMKLALNRA
jgi:hypothetical protein